MRRKLLLANLILALLTTAGLWQLRRAHISGQARYRTLDGTMRAPSAPAPGGQPAPVGPLEPAAYLDAAQKFLFSRDRNPTVAVPEPAKPKPRPALPQLFGVMNIGGGPVAIMAATPNTPHKTVRVGESIGEFKLLGAAGDQITLEWEGQAFQSQVSDLLVRPSREQATAAQAPPPPASSGAGATILNPSASGSGSTAEYKIGPAVQGASGTIYQSLPGDTAPHGAIFQGKRKVVRASPFGTSAWWEDAKN